MAFFRPGSILFDRSVRVIESRSLYSLQRYTALFGGALGVKLVRMWYEGKG